MPLLYVHKYRDAIGVGLIFNNFVRTLLGMNTKPKMGRPPKGKTGPKNERLEIRLEASEKAAIESAANQAGELVSDWARAVLLRNAKRKP